MSRCTEPEERVVEGESPVKVFAEHLARYNFAARYAPGRRVLDLACGSGYGTRLLSQAGASEVVGIDLDQTIVEYARARYGGAGVTFLQADAAALPPLAPFDLIVSFETIEHLDDPAGLLRSCGGLLAPGGLFLVSTPYRHRTRPDGTPRNPYHRQEWRTEEFEALLRGHFDDVALYGQALKVKARRFLPLSRRLGLLLARLHGRRPGVPDDIYPLPGPRFLGLWRLFPAYLVALCQKPVGGTGPGDA